MLVLSRYVEESIMIGDDIEIIVSEVRGKKVKLAIKAPENVKIFRKEIYNSPNTSKKN
ncbi:MAG: carbon storage regulator CsrA [Phycisphaerae bacterium]|nr:carbon storage regulator CsrA [Phycisphaerae bacterium]